MPSPTSSSLVQSTKLSLKAAVNPLPARRRLSPTDISQFIRLDQCQRYLALRLKEREAGRKFMYEYGVAPQSIPPLLTRSGASFEETVEKAMQKSGCELYHF